ncbi:MAG TPA: hypothetical protein PK002_04060, partial [Cellvibrio sp.]|nr:hypothetical protein [Cellvibrio sp.]
RIKIFQRTKNIPADGNINEQTLMKINETIGADKTLITDFPVQDLKAPDSQVLDSKAPNAKAASSIVQNLKELKSKEQKPKESN